MRTRFNWDQARSLLARWGWSEDSSKPQHWTIDAKGINIKPKVDSSKYTEYWIKSGKIWIIVPTIEDLECRDEYADFVSGISGIYDLNRHALEASLEAEQCQ